MIDFQTLKDIGSLTSPAIAVGGVFLAFWRFGGNKLVEKIDERSALRTAPLALATANLTTTVEEGFKAVAKEQKDTNDHLTKLNSKVATQEKLSGELSQRQAHTEGRLGLPLGGQPGTMTHVDGLAYIEGKKEAVKEAQAIAAIAPEEAIA